MNNKTLLTNKTCTSENTCTCTHIYSKHTQNVYIRYIVYIYTLYYLKTGIYE